MDRKTVLRALRTLTDQGVVQHTGQRTCIVAPATLAQSTLLGQTIVILTSYPPRNTPAPQPGWADLLTQGAMSGVNDIDHNALMVHGQRLLGTLNRCLQHPPAGILVTEMRKDIPGFLEGLERLHQAGVKLAVYSGSSEFDQYDRVRSDHEAGAYQLTRWLIDKGCGRILPLWEAMPAGPGTPPQEPTTYWVRQRRAGYERAMREAHLAPLAPLTMPDFPEMDWGTNRFEGAVRVIAGYLAEAMTGDTAVDGIMTMTDRTVYGVSAACRLFGRRPGKDVRLVGYDNYYQDCQSFFAAVAPQSVGPQATMDKQNDLMGRELVKLLMDRIEGKLPPEPQCRMVAPKFVPGEPVVNE